MIDSLYKCMVGTECFGYSHFLSIGFVEIMIEPANNIIFDSTELLDVEEYRMYTKAFCDLLKIGNFDCVFSMFVRDEFIEFRTEESEAVRKNRMNFVSRTFFDLIIEFALKAIETPIPKMTDNQEVNEQLLTKDLSVRMLAASYLYIAKSIAENMNIPDFANMNVLSTDPDKVNIRAVALAKEVRTLSKTFPYDIDSVLLKKILRARYMNRIK